MCAEICMVEIPAIRYRVNGTKFYLGLMKAKQVVGNYKVDLWKPNQPKGKKGYQRAHKERRSKRFATFLSEFNGFFHQTLLMNVRKESLADFEPESGNLGKLIIKQNAPIYMVDGQHRSGGLEMLLEDGHKYDNMPVPVLITVGRSRALEALDFFITNRAQEGVRAEHSDRILVEATGGLISDDLLAKVIGVRGKVELTQMMLEVVDELNKNASSIWKSRIALPGQRVSGPKIIRQTSFVNSLKPLLSNDITKSFFDELPEDLTDPLIDYWDAIAELCDEATGDDAKEYVLMKTTGTYIMHKLFPYVAMECKRPLTDAKMKKVVGRIEEMNDDDWASDGELGKLGGYKALDDEFSVFLKQIQEK